MNKAIFFDRDGVLNELVERNGGFYSPRKLSDFKIINNAAKVTKKTNLLGFVNIVISNQPDVSRGHMSKKELEKMTDRLSNKLSLDDFFYCIHDDSDLCNCRKPAAGLLEQAIKKWDIDLKKSLLIGDTWKDAEAANKVNVKCLLLDRVYNLDYKKVERIDDLKDIFNYL